MAIDTASVIRKLWSFFPFSGLAGAVGFCSCFKEVIPSPQPLLFGVIVAAVDAVQRSHVAAVIHGCRILLRGSFRFLVFFHNRGVLSVRSASAVFLLL